MSMKESFDRLERAVGDFCEAVRQKFNPGQPRDEQGRFGSGGGGGSESGSGEQFDSAASVKSVKGDLKKLGYRTKVEEEYGQEVLRLPKTVSSNIQVAQALGKHDWKEVNKNASINRNNTETYMTKGNHGISISAGSYGNQGASIRAWKPVPDESIRPRG